MEDRQVAYDAVLAARTLARSYGNAGGGGGQAKGEGFRCGANSLARTLTHSRLRQEEVEELTFISHSFEELRGLLPLLVFRTKIDRSTSSDSVSLLSNLFSFEEPKNCRKCTPITQAKLAAL